MESDASAHPPPWQGHVIILGLGHVGFRVFQLLRRLDERVAVVDMNPDPERAAEVRQAGGLLVAGDVRNPEILRRCGLAGAKALLALTNQELVNLSVAIDARQANPAAKIVIRLFDQELARHIRQVFAIQTVLSTTAIAAPLFAAAIFDDHNLACFQAHGNSWAAVHWHVDPGSPHVGQPLALFAEREACQPLLLQREGAISRIFDLEERFQAGDRAIGLRGDAKPAAKPALPRLRGRGWAGAAREFFAHMPRIVRLLLLTLVLLLASGIPAFRYGLQLSWLDACYFAVTTLTTTGYGDISLLNAADWVKAFGIVYMLGGAVLFASLIGMATDYLLSMRIREWLGLRAEPLRDHVILVGVGGLGLRIAEELQQRGKPLAACCPGQADDRFAGAVRAAARWVEGDPRNQEVLAQAGVSDARAILAITEDDVLNLSVSLLAKQMNPGIRAIARVFDGQLAEKLKDHLQIDQVYSISAASAPSFAASLYERSLTVGFVWGDYLVWISPCAESREAGEVSGRHSIAWRNRDGENLVLTVKLLRLSPAYPGLV